MKKLYLSSTFLIICYLSQAQINKGTVLLGGDLSAYSTATNPNGVHTKSTGISVNPSVGWAVSNNLVLGLDLGLGYSAQNQNVHIQENDYSAGFFLRKYKYLGAKFYFFGETKLEFSYSDQTEDQTIGYREDEKTTGLNLGFTPGVAYALSHRWQLEVAFPQIANLGYEQQKITYNIPTQGGTTQYETHELDHSYNLATSLTTDFQLQVGLRYLIGS